MVAALIFSSSPDPAWRLLAGLIAGGLGGTPVLAMLLGRGPHAIRGCKWGTDGTWQLTLTDGTTATGTLTPATATLGPWILLAWRTDVPVRHGSRRRYAVIEESRADLIAFRALKGRLTLLAGRPAGPDGVPGTVAR